MPDTKHQSDAARVQIVGFGYIGERIARLELQAGATVIAAVRSPERKRLAEEMGATPMELDLDRPETLRHLDARGARLYYLAPPFQEGDTDPRMGAVLKQLERSPPKSVVYISTTGVYGDCKGEWVSETTPPRPTNSRGRRRLHAETALSAWQRTSGRNVTILRVPGIYGPGRLPVERLRRGDPLLHEDVAPYLNLIHGDDLAQICVTAAKRKNGLEIFNVGDGHPTTMNTYFGELARLTGLPPPETVSLAEARSRLSPAMMSYLEESRRIDNHKLLHALGIQLRYPDFRAGLAASLS